MEKTALKTSEFIEETFYFWYQGNAHIRTPFPDYIRPKHREMAISKFHSWISQIPEEAKDELEEEIFIEKLEEILFETALKMVMTEDEKITILYPFLPRIGDSIQDEKQEKSIIIDRIIRKNEDNTFLKVVCQNCDTSEKWDTSFELPR